MLASSGSTMLTLIAKLALTVGLVFVTSPRGNAQSGNASKPASQTTLTQLARGFELVEKVAILQSSGAQRAESRRALAEILGILGRRQEDLANTSLSGLLRGVRLADDESVYLDLVNVHLLVQELEGLLATQGGDERMEELLVSHVALIEDVCRVERQAGESARSHADRVVETIRRFERILGVYVLHGFDGSGRPSQEQIERYLIDSGLPSPLSVATAPVLTSFREADSARGFPAGWYAKLDLDLGLGGPLRLEKLVGADGGFVIPPKANGFALELERHLARLAESGPALDLGNGVEARLFELGLRDGSVVGSVLVNVGNEDGAAGRVQLRVDGLRCRVEGGAANWTPGVSGKVRLPLSIGGLLQVPEGAGGALTIELGKDDRAGDLVVRGFLAPTARDDLRRQALALVDAGLAIESEATEVVAAIGGLEGLWPRVDLGALLPAAVLDTETWTNALPAAAVEFLGVEERWALRASAATVADAVSDLKGQLNADPADWLLQALTKPADNASLSAVAELELVFRVDDTIIRLAPVKVTADGGLQVPLDVLRVERLVSNQERIRQMFERAVPVWLTDGGASSATSDRRERSVVVWQLAIDPLEGVIYGAVELRSPWWDEALSLEVEFGIDGRPVPIEAALRRALAGRKLSLGPRLSATLAEDLPGRTDWFATVRFGAGIELGARVVRRDGRLDLDVDTTTLERDLHSTVESALERAGGSLGGTLSWSLREARFEHAFSELPITASARGDHAGGSLAALVVSVEVRTEGGTLPVEVRVDANGARVNGLETALARFAIERIRQTTGLRFEVDRRHRVRDDLVVDGAGFLGDRELFRTSGARFRSGAWVSAGRVELAPSFVQDVLGEVDTGPLKVLEAGLDDDLVPILDLRLDVRPLPPVDVRRLRLSNPGEAARQALDEAFDRAIRETIGDGVVEDVCGWQVRVEVDQQAGSPGRIPLRVSAEVKDVAVTVRFDEATIDLGSGLRLGPAAIRGGEALARRVSQQFEEILAGLAGSVPNPEHVAVERLAVVGDHIDSLAVTFDVVVNAAGDPIRFSGFRLSRLGLHAPSDLATQVAAPLLIAFESWIEGREVILGDALTLRCLEIDPERRRIEVETAFLGSSTGPATISFTRPDAPSLEWEDPRAVTTAVGDTPFGRALGPLASKLVVSRTQLRETELRVDLALQLELLGDATVLIGTLHVDSSGARLEGSDSPIAEVWNAVARAIRAAGGVRTGLPLPFELRRVESDESGVTMTLALVLPLLDETVELAGRIDRAGVSLDRPTALAAVARVIDSAVRRRVPEGAVRFDPVRVEGDAILMRGRVDLEVGEELVLDVGIDSEGRLVGLDERVLLSNLLSNLASTLKGEELVVLDDLVVRVIEVEPDLDAGGVQVDGIASLGPIALAVRGLMVTLDGVDVSGLRVEPDLTSLQVLVDSLGLFGLDKGELPRIEPHLDDGYVVVTIPIEIQEVFRTVMTLEIHESGVRIVLPMKVGLEAAIPIPPFFSLQDPWGEIHQDKLRIGADLTLAPPQSNRLLAVRGVATIPLGGPLVFRMDGDLYILQRLNLGRTFTVLDLGAPSFESTLQYDLLEIVQLEGMVRLRFDQFELLWDVGLEALGARLLAARVYLNGERFQAQAMVNLLAAMAEAHVIIPLDDAAGTDLGAKLAFGLFVFGQNLEIAGARVEANLRRGAEFAAVILGQDISLLTIDLEGITKERIRDLILKQPVCLTGFKLFASEGGGGVVRVGENGSMAQLQIDPSTGETTVRVLFEDDGEIALGHVRTSGGGGRTVEVVRPASGEVHEVEFDKQGNEVNRRAMLVRKGVEVEINADAIEVPNFLFRVPLDPAQWSQVPDDE